MAGDDRARLLRWKCRRGMKELDVLLETFLARHEADLRGGGWPELDRFLALEDDVLWDLLRRNVAAAESEFGNLIDAIRDERGGGT